MNCTSRPPVRKCQGRSLPVAGTLNSTHAMIVKSHAAQTISVLGTQVRILCEGHSTNNACSLMEVTLPQGSVPPLHTHRWDEAYFIIEGEPQFILEIARHG